MKLTILAVDKNNYIISPKTKKNSPMIVQNLGRAILLPSAAYQEWERAALRTFVHQNLIRKFKETTRTGKEKDAYALVKDQAINYPVNCRAIIYRDKLHGDAVGFYQAIGDFLQLAGFVTNDRLIVSWDGSRMDKDAKRPRIELELTAVGEPALFMGGE